MMTFVRFNLSLILSGMIAATSATAASSPLNPTTNRCESLLTLPFAPKKTSAMTVIDLEAIKAVFESDDSTERKMNEAFEIYLNARLRQLTPKRRRLVEPYAKDLKIEFVYSSMPIIADAGTVQMPEDLKPSIIPWVALVHEVEHRIQMKLGEHGSWLQNANLLATIVLDGPWLYFAEVRAMQAESEFMNALPEELILGSKELVHKKRTGEIWGDSIYLKYFNIMLGGFGMDPLEYVKYQHRAGRYSALKIAKKSLAPLGALVGICTLYGTW